MPNLWAFYEGYQHGVSINELDQSLSVQNSVRIEVLGSLQYKGLKSNLRNNFVEELEAFKPESAIESVNKILDIWIKGKILGNKFCKTSSSF